MLGLRRSSLQHAPEVSLPEGARLISEQILHLMDVGDDGVIVMYEYVLTTGERYRNMEFSTVRDGKLTETRVYFGGGFPPRAAG